jgi:hypothetical protein
LAQPEGLEALQEEPVVLPEQPVLPEPLQVH